MPWALREVVARLTKRATASHKQDLLCSLFVLLGASIVVARLRGRSGFWSVLAILEVLGIRIDRLCQGGYVRGDDVSRFHVFGGGFKAY